MTYIRRFGVPKSIFIGYRYKIKANLLLKDLRMASAANSIPELLSIGSSYCGKRFMISTRHRSMSSSVKTSPSMMRWIRTCKLYSCDNLPILSVCRRTKFRPLLVMFPPEMNERFLYLSSCIASSNSFFNRWIFSLIVPISISH